jgi:hypothetical protein
MTLKRVMKICAICARWSNTSESVELAAACLLVFPRAIDSVHFARRCGFGGWADNLQKKNSVWRQSVPVKIREILSPIRELPHWYTRHVLGPFPQKKKVMTSQETGSKKRLYFRHARTPRNSRHKRSLLCPIGHNSLIDHHNQV